MIRPRVFALLVCALPFTSGRASAQSPVPATVLAIDQAVTEAIAHNLAIVAERYNLAVADARVLTARLRPNPVLTVNAMLPDPVIFNNGVNPKEGVVRGDVLIEGG